MTRVTLRPVRESDLAVFEEEFGTPAGRSELQWFGFRSPGRDRRAYAENGMLHDDGGTLTVCAGEGDGGDGDVAGRVDWGRASGWGPPAESWCWTIGILLRPAFRGRGIGTEAQRRLVAYLFDHTRAHRVQAYTDTRNRAEQRALEKAGFRREGVLREAQWRAGAWHDQLLYALLRTDPHRPV